MSEYVYVDRGKFEDWVEEIDASVTRTPGGRHSNIRVEGTLPETGIEFRMNVIGVLRKDNEYWYARGDDWNRVRVDLWGPRNFHLYGKGARSTTVYEEVQGIVDELTCPPPVPVDIYEEVLMDRVRMLYTRFCVVGWYMFRRPITTARYDLRWSRVFGGIAVFSPVR